mgnify:CR=1 FL=1|tara:strand:- start:450 stop:755 length:306 start_codon:yes stop_codon:yes gene_type:complete
MKKYKLRESQLKSIEQMEFVCDNVYVNNVNFVCLEEIKEPLKRGDKVRFKDFNSDEWFYGWFSKDDSCFTLQRQFVDRWNIIEAHEWTDADLMPDVLKEGK